MRLYDISRIDVETDISRLVLKGVDDDGNARWVGLDPNDRAIIVIVANDDPQFIITTFPRD